MTDIEDRLRLPAIGLIATGGANLLVAIILALGWINDLFAREPRIWFASESARRGYYFGYALAVIWNLAGLVLAPVIISGGMEMLSGTGYHKAKRAAILAMVPITSVCCVLGLPLGFWAFKTLGDPEVRTFMGADDAVPVATNTGPY